MLAPSDLPTRAPWLSEDLSLAYRPEAWDEGRQLRKLETIGDHLRRHGSVPRDQLDDELKTSLANTERTFAIYHGRARTSAGGSFAFVVPSRLNSSDSAYAGELIRVLPILRHVDPRTRYRAFVGTCPWFIDSYRPAANGSAGVMLMAPVFGEISREAGGLSAQARLVQSITTATCRFAVERLGVEIVGLGAILPKLTRHGRTIGVEGLRTTTGHAGTVWLVGETIRAVRHLLSVARPERVGILGVGAIGLASAEAYLCANGSDSIRLFDTDPGRLRWAYDRLGESYGRGRVKVAASCRDLLERNDVIVSAITRPVDLEAPEMVGLDLSGKVIVDDSQPASFDREIVERRGGHVVWVIGQDRSIGGTVTKEGGFDYGGWGPVSAQEVWGCEAEVACLSWAGDHIPGITAPVTVDNVVQIGGLFDSLGIGVAPLQSFGSYLDPAEHGANEPCWAR